MADDPAAAPNPAPGDHPDATPSYFCYQCNKEVSVEGNQDAMTCTECNGGFLEAITTVSPEFHRPPRRPAAGSRRRRSDPTTVSLSDALEHMYPHQMLQMVQILLEAARNNRAAQSAPAPSSAAAEHDDPPEAEAEAPGAETFSEDGESDGTGGLRLELEAFDLNDDEDEWEEAEDEDHIAAEGGNGEEGGTISEGGGGMSDESIRRARNNFNFYMRELFQSLLDQNVEVRVELPDLYLGNPGDYLDSVGFEQLLQQLAESDTSRRGAPPAAKSAVEMLESVRIRQEHIESGIAVCAICKEQLTLEEAVKQLPCMHLYHPDCILPWLGSRNSCPVCRFELPTDDPDYEEQKRGRKGGNSGSSELSEEACSSNISNSSSSSSSGGGSLNSESGNGSSGGRGGVSRSWLILAVGPVLSVMGFVFMSLANHLVGRQLPLSMFQESPAAAATTAAAQRHWWSFH